uniref:Uncharacterized protein n=1 Tax=Ditylenchus dipsaci TaxID=166011 RepID=A0A915EEC2_9BILA
MVFLEMEKEESEDSSDETIHHAQTVNIDEDAAPTIVTPREVHVEKQLTDEGSCRNCKGFCENAEQAWAMCADYGEKLAFIRELQTENQQLRSINNERQIYLASQQQKFQQMKNTLDRKDIIVAEVEDKHKCLQDQYNQILGVATEAQAAANQWREKYEESQKLLMEVQAKFKETHQLNLSSMSVAATFSNKFEQEQAKSRHLEEKNAELLKRFEGLDRRVLNLESVRPATLPEKMEESCLEKIPPEDPSTGVNIPTMKNPMNSPSLFSASTSCQKTPSKEQPIPAVNTPSPKKTRVSRVKPIVEEENREVAEICPASTSSDQIPMKKPKDLMPDSVVSPPKKARVSRVKPNLQGTSGSLQNFEFDSEKAETANTIIETRRLETKQKSPSIKSPSKKAPIIDHKELKGKEAVKEQVSFESSSVAVIPTQKTVLKLPTVAEIMSCSFLVEIHQMPLINQISAPLENTTPKATAKEPEADEPIKPSRSQIEKEEEEETVALSIFEEEDPEDTEQPIISTKKSIKRSATERGIINSSSPEPEAAEQPMTKRRRVAHPQPIQPTVKSSVRPTVKPNVNPTEKPTVELTAKPNNKSTVNPTEIAQTIPEIPKTTRKARVANDRVARLAIQPTVNPENPQDIASTSSKKDKASPEIKSATRSAGATPNGTKSQPTEQTNEKKSVRAPTRPRAPARKPKAPVSADVDVVAMPPAAPVAEKVVEQPKQAVMIELPQNTRPRAVARNARDIAPPPVRPKPTEKVCNSLDSQLISSFHQATKPKGRLRAAGVKANLFKANPTLPTLITTDKLAELMCRALLETEMGDLWMGMKSQTVSQDMMLSSMEKKFFEFANELAAEPEWTKLFYEFTMKLSLEVSKTIASSANLSLSQLSRNFRCLALAKVCAVKCDPDDAQSKELTGRLVFLLETIVSNMSSAYVVPILCYLATIDANLVVHHFLTASEDSLKHKLLRLHLTETNEFIGVARSLICNRLGLEEICAKLLSPVTSQQLSAWLVEHIEQTRNLADGVVARGPKLW